MEPIKITYKISLDDREEQFDFNLDAETYALQNQPTGDIPEWAELGYRQCEHCPLNADQHPHCPVALQLVDVVQRFEDSRSIDEVTMEVITEERHVIQETALQRAIASILELVFPASGCPKTEPMRPLARFHLPMASEEETVFRVTGMYLLGQYFLSKVTGRGSIKFDGLANLYEELGVLDKAVASRLQIATRSDSVKNAITLLDMYSTLVPLLLDDELAEMRTFFKAYLPEGDSSESVPATTNYFERIKTASLALEPVAESSDEDKPAWLKKEEEAADKESPSPAAIPEAKPTHNKVDEILKGSTLSLEPVDRAEEEKPKSGKAKFSLPDD